MTVEARDEHAEVGLEKLNIAKQCLPVPYSSSHFWRREEAIDSVKDLVGQVDA